MAKPTVGIGQKIVKRGLLSYLKWAKQVAKSSSLKYERRPGIKKQFFYVIESSLPFSENAYTMRSHDLLQALVAEDVNAQAVARIGFPADIGIKFDSGQKNIDGVLYNFLSSAKHSRYSLSYIWQSSWVLTDFFTVNNAAVVHAATNYNHAWAALLAAQRLGLPFFYEIRGLYDSANAVNKHDLQGLVLGLELESLLAQQADRVFVASADLKQYAAENMAINNHKIDVLPDAGDYALNQQNWAEAIQDFAFELKRY